MMLRESCGGADFGACTGADDDNDENNAEVDGLKVYRVVERTCAAEIRCVMCDV
jgi:hypothetical protein